MQNLPVEFHHEQVFGVEAQMIHGSFATGVAQADGFTATHAVGAIATGAITVGAVVIPERRGGSMAFITTAADDEYLSYVTTNEIFEFVIGKPIRFRGVLTPGLTAELPEELNIFLGCMENMDTATEFQDAGAGMRALCGDMFGFFKPSNDSVIFNQYWHCVTGHNDIEQYTELSAANNNNESGVDWKIIDGNGDGIEREFIAEWMPINVVPGVGAVAPTIIEAEVRYWIDGILVCKHLQRAVYLITIATTQEMSFGVVITNITDISVLNASYLKCEQLE